MIKSNNSIFIKCFFVLFMNLTWISETFAGIESKKAILSAKKVLKIGSKSFFSKKTQTKGTFGQNEFSKKEINQINIERLMQPLAVVTYIVNIPSLIKSSGDKLKEQMLYPHHGFW